MPAVRIRVPCYHCCCLSASSKFCSMYQDHFWEWRKEGTLISCIFARCNHPFYHSSQQSFYGIILPHFTDSGRAEWLQRCISVSRQIQSGHRVPVISYTCCFISSILAFFFLQDIQLPVTSLLRDQKNHAWLITLCQHLVDLKKKLETGVTKFKFILQVPTSLFLPLPVTILQLIHQAFAELWIVAASACFPRPLPGICAQVLEMAWHWSQRVRARV